MEHSFNTKLAEILGIEKAVLVRHFFFWIAKNAANRVHFHDGRYWTYNSASALAELFPYLSADSIKRHIKKLVDDGFLLKGNYNKVKMDRTNWYALSDYAESIMQKCEMDCAILHNGKCENAQPIPDIITDIETDNKKECKKESIDKDLSFVEEGYKESMLLYLDYRKKIGKPLKPVSYKASYEKLKTLSGGVPAVAREIVAQTIGNGWQGLFELKDKKKNERASENLRLFVTQRDPNEPEHDDLPF